MTGPFRARYGASDNKHALLNFEGEGVPPRALLGLTDKPAGSYRPGDIWWPSIGFGPVGEWWVLWCTRPDNDAIRAGMVTSRALLWPMAEIGDVADLTPYIEEVTGVALNMPTAPLAQAAAQAIFADSDRPPVVVGLKDWPGLIATFWKRLPDMDRKAFSGRVMVSPPQHGSDDRCTLLCTPDDRAAQWASGRLVREMPLESISRAARWLAGSDDSGIAQITQALSSQMTLGRLGTIARAAERLDALRDRPSPEDAILLLRSLILIAPSSDTLTDLKLEAIAVIAAGIEDVDACVMKLMANIEDDALPDLVLVKEGMTRWIRHNMPKLEPGDVSSIVQALAPGRSRDWWKQTVQSAIANHLYSAPWSQALLRWLSFASCRLALCTIWSFDKLEKSMIAVTEKSGVMASQDTSGMLDACTTFGWSTLHAQICGRTLAVRSALERQLAFPGNPVPGLEWLVWHTDGQQLVAATAALDIDVLTSLVAVRTAREPALLSQMMAEPKWLSLWTQHIIHAGPPWPASVDRAAMCTVLLQGFDSVDVSQVLIRAIESDLAARVFEWPRRGELWARLPDDFVERVASVALERVNTGAEFPLPEEPLGSRIVQKARRTRPTAAGLMLLLRWHAGVSERDVLTWIASVQLDHRAAEIGKRIGELGWSRVAEELYRRSAYDSQALLAALACKALLSSWQQFILEFRGNRAARASQQDLHTIEDRIVSIGASYAEERLKDMWIRAGGDVSRLSLSTYPRDRWRDAARAARSGALRGGLLALVQQLLDEFPNNEELKDIRAILANA
ncbi:effector-associated domain EAD1-containing protein [Burkholderia gladioli]|jgi:hypothetical protein|uniref:GAP1-N1 domain-containing protein n=1 Tax=Burkholderia gladioli TaxID=28095 RepID=UPI00163FD37B|nr:effector-associated domain EAD1-containing protein [Burkholderia gladioli]